MKKILLGVTGSIAAYKCAELVRLLKKANCEVRVVMTRSACEIITPMTLQVFSHNEVRIDLFDHEDEAKIDHIALARWPDQILIAPASANTMAKMAHGIADDLLSTLCLATDAPLAIAPAMNRQMWEHPATQQNLATLVQRGVEVIEPGAGEQACGEVGVGRMAEPQELCNWLTSEGSSSHEKPLLGQTIMITAGPTIERIDPVRYITNDSSGKMGYSFAEQAMQLGAEVILVSGKTQLLTPKGARVIDVVSARDMLDAVLAHADEADYFIATAAVADYTVASPAQQKMKKHDDDGLTLELVQNPDILQTVCRLANKPFCIGFAAETHDVIDNARAKRKRKGVDLIVANDVSDSAIGFNSDNNAAVLIGDDFEHTFSVMPKSQLARELLLSAYEYKSRTS